MPVQKNVVYKQYYKTYNFVEFGHSYLQMEVKKKNAYY